MISRVGCAGCGGNLGLATSPEPVERHAGPIDRDRPREDGMGFNGIFRVAVGLALAGAGASLPVASARAADPYDVNVILPLTGSASFLGKAEHAALQLAEKWVNDNGGIQGRPLHLVIQDDQSSPQLAVQLASQVIARHPAVLIGSSLVAMCNAM